MISDISEHIRKSLLKKKPIDVIRLELVHMGYHVAEIDQKIAEISSSMPKRKSRITRFLAKDILDRIGYGLGSVQFLNIFLYIISGSVFLIGIANAIKIVLSLITSLVMEEYIRLKNVYKRTIGYSGILLGLSFALFSAAIYFRSTVLFLIVLWGNAIVIVPYGSLYQKMFRNSLIEERRKSLIGKLSYAGLFVTGLALFGGAYCLDLVGIEGKEIIIWGTRFQAYGYLLTLNGAALAIILSSYIFYFIYWKKIEEKASIGLWQEVLLGFGRAKEFWLKVQVNRILLILTITCIMTGILQTLGNSYYGLFIFRMMSQTGFGPWMNVAIIFILATLASAVSPSITRNMAKEYGKVPMLAFGAALMGILPFSYFYKPSLVTIGMGTIAGIIGSSINGVATGLLIRDYVRDGDLPTFMQMNTLLSVLPYLIFVPIGALVAQMIGIRHLFIVITVLFFVMVIPLYLIILVLHREEKI